MIDVPVLDSDCVVIGRGPAGSTAAAMLARSGYRVLLERDRRSLFHIGESLLPASIPIVERLGVLDRIEAIGMRKLGADDNPFGLARA